MKKVISIFVGIGFSIILIEIILNIYNPFTFRLDGEVIDLPKNIIYHIDNDQISALPENITHSKNNIGFRGEDYSDEKKPKIFFVGGSTTECFYLTDGKDWPNLVKKKWQNSSQKIWFNNAGLDGHSTYGHIKLIEQLLSKLNSDFIVFLIGVNEISRFDLFKTDKINITSNQSFLKNLQLIKTINVIKNTMKSSELNLTHKSFDYTQEAYKESPIDSIKFINQQISLQNSYRVRINRIIELCDSIGTKPVFITQPILWGNITDNLLDVNLGNYKIGSVESSTYANGLLLFNNTLISVCTKSNVQYIPLHEIMPKNSEYYYDGIHFTEEGSEKVAEIIFNNLNIND